MLLSDLLRRFLADNPKYHEISEITESIHRFGFIAPVIINDTTGKIIGGNGRVEALGLEFKKDKNLVIKGITKVYTTNQNTPPHVIDWEVPVYNVEVDPGEEMAAVVALNALVERGGWDTTKLSKILDSIKDRRGTGYGPINGVESPQLKKLLETARKNSSPLEIPYDSTSLDEGDIETDEENPENPSQPHANTPQKPIRDQSKILSFTGDTHPLENTNLEPCDGEVYTLGSSFILVGDYTPVILTDLDSFKMQPFTVLIVNPESASKLLKRYPDAEMLT